MENRLNLMETPLLPDRQRTQVPVRLERLLLMCLVLVLPGCHRVEDNPGESPEQETSLFNLAHLDHLGETVRHDSATLRIIHIYAEAPTYTWVADDDEGIACVDDAARAAVVYLRHFEITGDESSREKAEQLLRFVMRMQRSDGLFTTSCGTISSTSTQRIRTAGRMRSDGGPRAACGRWVWAHGY